MAASANGALQPPLTAPMHFSKTSDMPSLLDPPADDDLLPSATKGASQTHCCTWLIHRP